LADRRTGKPLRVGLISLGCSKNLIDSEVMLGQVAGEGFAVTGDIGEADVVVVNTCGFIDAAKQESIDTVLEVAELKKKGQIRGVVVTGCMAQRYPEELAKELPMVDAILGLTAESEMPAILRQIAGAAAAKGNGGARAKGGLKKLPMAAGTTARAGMPKGSAKAGGRAGKGPVVVVRDPSKPFGSEVGRLRLTPRHYAYLRVAEGCDHECTFCAIPSFRGRFRSKSEEDVLLEARELAADGAAELNLIAEDTNQFGQDRRDGSSLATLLRRLAAEVEGVRWLRILYAYPAYFPDALVRAIAETEEVVKYLDIPLQHVADPVLARMRRPSKRKTFALLERLRKEIPGLVLRTTFICGFPGETEADHEELIDAVKGFGFDRVGAFAYSPEDGTPAHALAGHLPDDVRKARRDAVMAAQQDVAFARARAAKGRAVEVLVEGETEDGRLIARTPGDAPEIDPVCYLAPLKARKGGNLRVDPGTFLTARITGAEGYDLVGEIVR
jgi:ribosomal protein S12 methylthiotransferase